MARNIIYKKGFTLIELVLYMGIFTLLVSGVLHTSVYLQKVMQSSSVEYEINKIIYTQLQLLQNHMLHATHIQVSTSSISILTPSNIITQELRGGHIYMLYQHSDGQVKEFELYPTIRFSQFSFSQNEVGETFETKNRVQVRVERIDNKSKTKSLEEYLYTY